MLPELDLDIDFDLIVGVQLSGMAVDIDGAPLPLIALIGRNVLERCVFVYDGPGAAFTLAA
ncbi:MAG: hypothetical protein HY873_11685 [Chloroflexi bacterium]|nr:hypothetical protein [Chloroflexota bacterium]